MKNVFTIDADIKLKMLINEPTVVQNDDIRFIINVFDGGQPLSLDSATTVSLASVRLDRRTVVTPGTKIGTNTVQFDLGTEETKFPGRVKATAQFYDNEGRISTISFSYRVVKDPTGDGYIPTEREQTLIETVLNDGPLVIQQAQDAANFANEQGQFAQTQANTAREAAANATNAATNANNAADNANTQAVYAQTQGDYAKAQGDAASLAVENANNALAAVNEAVNNANTAIENANVAADNANLAAERANNEANYAKAQGDYAKAQAELINDILDQGSVSAVNGKTGNVTLTAEDVGAIPTSEKGVAGGVARLNEFGKVVDANGMEVEGKVKTVNGIGPDENGNIEIETATNWNDLSDKPNSFPPSAHTHQISEINGLQDALNEKASSEDLTQLDNKVMSHLADDVSKGEVHGLRVTDGKLEYFDGQEWQQVKRGNGEQVYWQDIQNKPSTFPASPHTHSISQIDGLQERLENIPVDVDWNDIKDKPSSFPPSSHNHSISQISGLQDELNSLKSRISDLELEVDLLKNGTDDKALQYLVKEHITTNVIDEPRNEMVDVVQYPDDFQVGENFSVELKGGK